MNIIELDSATLEPGSLPWVEAQIGEAAALTVLLMLERMQEHKRGEDPSETSRMGPAMMTCLIGWKMDPRLIGLDFEGIIRQRTPAVLHLLCPGFTNEQLAKMIDDMLKMTNDIIKKYVN